MPNVYLRSIEPLSVIVLGCMRRKGAQADGDAQKRMIDEHRRLHQKETTMPNRSESLGYGRAARCAARDATSRLVRHYSRRTPLCPKQCVDRSGARRARDSNWLGWLRL